MKAIWNDQVIAESDETIMVENNHYFPETSLNAELFSASEKRSYCPWKGEASYYSINVDGKLNPDAAWHYEQPKDAASEIAGRVAFWRGVEVVA
jgi:uncharacterized protein (DUF427 family)